MDGLGQGPLESLWSGLLDRLWNERGSSRMRDGSLILGGVGVVDLVSDAHVRQSTICSPSPGGRSRVLAERSSAPRQERWTGLASRRREIGLFRTLSFFWWLSLVVRVSSGEEEVDEKSVNETRSTLYRPWWISR